jgi:hypothetical protein
MQILRGHRRIEALWSAVQREASTLPAHGVQDKFWGMEVLQGQGQDGSSSEGSAASRWQSVFS